jgi:hypothetical protein
MDPREVILPSSVQRDRSASIVISGSTPAMTLPGTPPGVP